MKITAVVLTKNEENNINRCLKSLDFCDEVIIVDDYSTDDTKNQYDKLNVKVFKKHLNNDFAQQRNFGLEKATNDWVLFVDADEVVTEKLKSEIQNSKFEKEAYFIKRRDYFWGRELKYGEVSKVRKIGLIRLTRKDSGKWMGSVHEVFHTASNVGQLNGFLDHHPHPSLKEFINDINRYSDIRAEELLKRGVKINIFQIIFFPFGKFIYNYFLKFGFCDGPAGFTYAFMMSFHSFLVRTKLYQRTNKC